MKKLITMIMIMMVSVFTFTSCSKDIMEDAQLVETFNAAFNVSNFNVENFGSSTKATMPGVYDNQGAPVGVASLQIVNTWDEDPTFGIDNTYNFGSTDANDLKPIRMEDMRFGDNTYQGYAIQVSNRAVSGLNAPIDWEYILDSEFVDANTGLYYRDFYGTFSKNIQRVDVTDVPDANPELTDNLELKLAPLNSIVQIKVINTHPSFTIVTTIKVYDINNILLNTYTTSVDAITYTDYGNFTEILLNTTDLVEGNYMKCSIDVKDGDTSVLTTPKELTDQNISANIKYIIEGGLVITPDSFDVDGNFNVTWDTSWTPEEWGTVTLGW